MTWTHGQPPRGNQSPFIDPKRENTGRQNYNPNHRQPQEGSRQYRPQQNNVAATFTQEGLQTFSQIFASSVEAAIAQVLPEMIERVLDKKMNELVNQMRDQVEQMISRSILELGGIGQTLTTESSIGHTNNESVIVSDRADPSKKTEDNQGSIQSMVDCNHIISVLKEAGHPVKAADLRALAPQVNWGNNPSVKLNNLLHKSNGKIERVGRGLYQYTGA